MIKIVLRRHTTKHTQACTNAALEHTKCVENADSARMECDDNTEATYPRCVRDAEANRDAKKRKVDYQYEKCKKRSKQMLNACLNPGDNNSDDTGDSNYKHFESRKPKLSNIFLR